MSNSCLDPPFCFHWLFSLFFLSFLGGCFHFVLFYFWPNMVCTATAWKTTDHKGSRGISGFICKEMSWWAAGGNLFARWPADHRKVICLVLRTVSFAWLCSSKLQTFPKQLSFLAHSEKSENYELFEALWNNSRQASLAGTGDIFGISKDLSVTEPCDSSVMYKKKSK